MTVANLAIIAAKPGETLVGSTTAFRIFEGPHGFRLVRLNAMTEASLLRDVAQTAIARAEGRA